MTQDDIIRMAREAGFTTGIRHLANGVDGFAFAKSVSDECLPELYQFAHLVAAAERERIAAMLDKMHEGKSGLHNYFKVAAVAVRNENAST